MGEPKKPSETVPQELSNEWSCYYVQTILNNLGYYIELNRLQGFGPNVPQIVDSVC
jgi:hypothetical protein